VPNGTFCRGIEWARRVRVLSVSNGRSYLPFELFGPRSQMVEVAQGSAPPPFLVKRGLSRRRVFGFNYRPFVTLAKCEETRLQWTTQEKNAFRRQFGCRSRRCAPFG
jgi:hypothetical protein